MELYRRHLVALTQNIHTQWRTTTTTVTEWRERKKRDNIQNLIFESLIEFVGLWCSNCTIKCSSWMTVCDQWILKQKQIWINRELMRERERRRKDLEIHLFKIEIFPLPCVGCSFLIYKNHIYLHCVNIPNFIYVDLCKFILWILPNFVVRIFSTVISYAFIVHYLVHFKLDINFKIVMFIWWQQIWNTDLLRPQHHYQQQQNQKNQQISITNVSTKRQRSHIANRRQPTHTPHQMPYSIHNCSTRQSKCIRMSSTEQSSRMKSFCSVVILIHCFNVLVLSIASENSTSTQPQPCDRTRRVYTDVQGEISNGPFGSNYTQVSTFICLSVLFSFQSIDVPFTVSWLWVGERACCSSWINFIFNSNQAFCLLQKRDERKMKKKKTTNKNH